jgi:hypothetical protein
VIVMKQQKWNMKFSDYIEALENMRGLTQKERLAIMTNPEANSITVEMFDELWGQAKDATRSGPNEGRSCQEQ